MTNSTRVGPMRLAPSYSPFFSSEFRCSSAPGTCSSSLLCRHIPHQRPLLILAFTRSTTTSDDDRTHSSFHFSICILRFVLFVFLFFPFLPTVVRFAI